MLYPDQRVSYWSECYLRLLSSLQYEHLQKSVLGNQYATRKQESEEQIRRCQSSRLVAAKDRPNREICQCQNAGQTKPAKVEDQVLYAIVNARTNRVPTENAETGDILATMPKDNSSRVGY